jgi:hypothetical protein
MAFLSERSLYNALRRAPGRWLGLAMFTLPRRGYDLMTHWSRTRLRRTTRGDAPSSHANRRAEPMDSDGCAPMPVAARIVDCVAVIDVVFAESTMVLVNDRFYRLLPADQATLEGHDGCVSEHQQHKPSLKSFPGFGDS